MNKNKFAELYVVHGETYPYEITPEEIKNLLEDEEVQTLLKNKLASRNIADMVKVYNSMLTAVTEDKNVNAAKWMIEFSKSKFLTETESELDKLMNRVTIKKGGKNE